MTNQILQIQIKRLPHGNNIDLPQYHSEHAAGMDLHAAVNNDTLINPGKITVIPCGFSLAIPVGYEAQIRPRSGLASRHGISMPNTPGTIDADYRGEVMVPIINLSDVPFTVTRNMRIAQMLVKPILRTTWLEVDELPDSSRGEGGFGHTGH